jgi:outer membrane protein insertion porin family
MSRSARGLARAWPRVLACVFACVFLPAAVRAQVADPELYEDRPVREIRVVDFAADGGPGDALGPDLEQRVRNEIRMSVGLPYRNATLTADVERLNRLGIFARVESYVQQLADGGVLLSYVVEVQPVIQDVQVTGNRKLNDAQLAGAVDLLVGTPIDRFQIDRAARRIEDLYREKGYYLARVTVDLEELEESSIVLFRIREGQRIKITDIRFEGNETIPERLLRREIDTHVAGLFRRGALDDLQLDRDVGAVIAFYRNEGYLDVRADRIIRPSPDSKEAVVVFLIDEGPVYTLRSLRVEFDQGVDETVFTREQIQGLLALNPGDVYSKGLVDESLAAIRSAYGQLGFADAFPPGFNAVRAFELRDTERPEVDLLLRINPGRRYTTGEVVIAGNSITKQNVIRRQVEVRPGRPLDMTAIERTERRLEQLRLFSPLPPDRGVKLTLQPPDPGEPEFRDVLIEVTETDTGEFSIGGAVSSDQGLVGRIALTQRNFDVRDTPDSLGDMFSGGAFRGAGQTFQIEALPGVDVQTYSISLSEPYLLESDYSGSVNAFYRDREFDEFDEERFGGAVSVGRRFGTRWSGSLALRANSVGLTNIAPDRPVDVFEFADRSLFFGLSPSIARTSLDRFFLPNRGSRTELSVEQVFGDYTFNTIRADHSVYIPIRQDFLGRDTVLKFEGRIAYQPQDEDDVPVYERMYMGGNTFRGFEFRTISPKGIRNDTGELGNDPVGGTWLFFAGIEVRQPVYEEILHVVGFLDTGTVTNEPGFEEYRVSIGVGVRFSIPQLSPAPIALDFGFPIVDEEGDESQVFTFSVDLPF